MKPMLTLFFALTLSPLVTAWDNNDIDRAWRIQSIEQLQSINPDDEFGALYRQYRIALLAQEQGNKKLAKKSLSVILDALEDNYQTADQAALYYNALGLSIALKPWTAAFTLKKANKAMEFSESKTPNHAPTLVAKAVGLINRPAFAGGDKALALTYLDQALTLYQQTEAWAYEDAWLWKVKALIALDKPEEAAKHLKSLQNAFPDFTEAQRISL
jgi:tetratricopeptide (TPR) repeat protein